MEVGQIVCGKSGYPLHGKRGSVLYAERVSMRVSVVISWNGGKDVDICGVYNVIPGAIGFDHSTSIQGGGFKAVWTSNDNTSGGPETVSLEYDGNRSSLADVFFDIHANWFRVGDDSGSSGGGTATVTATDSSGATRSFTLNPGTSKGRAANTGDPGARISFNVNGTVKSITAC